MLYDSTPQYPHYSHLPFAREPLKSLYVFQRLFSTLLLVPCWALYYLVLPRSFRPRPSWSLRQIIFVNFTRRIYKVTEVAGVTWGTRNPDDAPVQSLLKETRFEWVDPLADNLRSGVVVDDRVPFKRVGVFVWPQIPSNHNTRHGNGSKSRESAARLEGAGIKGDGVPDVESSPAEVPVIGIFMHGGGYCHMSAHEISRTSRIPRRLIQKKMFTEVYSVEYRLLQYAPFPAVVQDAAAVYAHVANRYGAKKSKCKIVLIGDSSGGNLVLSLARWIRDEGKLPLPDGLLLLSPSCDTSHAIPDTPSSYIPRPHASTDYLVDTPEPRALLQRTFLGFKYRPVPANGFTHQQQEEEEQRLMEILHSEYVSPVSPRVLKRWGHPVEQQLQIKDGDGGSDTPSNTNLMATGTSGNLTPPTDSPYQRSSRFPKLFSSFPRTLVIVGDAERLEREVKSLIGAMERDGVDVTTEWVKDAVHDILIIAEGWWDESAREGAWKAIGEWMAGI